MRERLRARIRRKIRSLPAEEVDENINILNQQPELVTMIQERSKPTALQDQKVRPLQDHKVRCGLCLCFLCGENSSNLIR